MVEMPIDHFFTVLYYGEHGVGRTTINCVFQGHSFTPFTINLPRLPLKHYRKTYIIRGKKIETTIPDSVKRQSYFGSLELYLQAKNANGIIFIYSVNSSSSFKIIAKINNLERYAEKEIITVLIGNQCDCAPEKREVSYEEGKKLAERLGMKFFETSAKYNINIKEVFMYLTKEIYKNFESKAPKKNFSIQDYKKQNKNKCYK